MALLEEDHAFEIADVVIAASDADETEVSVACVEERFVRFAHEGPTHGPFGTVCPSGPAASPE